MVIIDCIYSDIDKIRVDNLITFILNYFNIDDKEVSITFISDENIKLLNYKYRNINKATDVLSFPLLEGEDITDESMLGDIVISYDTALKQSKEFNHPLFIEIDNLICHSMLHLLGYDHLCIKEKQIMFELHKKILNEFFKNNNSLKYLEDNWMLNL